MTLDVEGVLEGSMGLKKALGGFGGLNMEKPDFGAAHINLN
ncbi:MAG: hypothetical protein ACE5JZ_06005 [Kiloniellales bacterium]